MMALLPVLLLAGIAVIQPLLLFSLCFSAALFYFVLLFSVLAACGYDGAPASLITGGYRCHPIPAFIFSVF